jgi:hypothetical protein
MFVSKRYLLKKYFPYTWFLRYLLDIGIIIRASITPILGIIIRKNKSEYYNNVVKNYIDRLKMAIFILIGKQ